MSRYLLSVHSAPGDAPEQPPPDPDAMQQMMQHILALEEEMSAAGAFVFGGRLDDAAAATVVRPGDGSPTTDGPFVETKEHIAGFYIVEAADDDGALGWAAKVVAAIGAPIEVRRFAATGRAADHVG